MRSKVVEDVLLQRRRVALGESARLARDQERHAGGRAGARGAIRRARPIAVVDDVVVVDARRGRRPAGGFDFQTSQRPRA